MTLVLFMGAIALFGWSLSERLWARESRHYTRHIGPFERVASAGLLALVAWVSLDWLFALTHTLSGAMLLSGAAVMAAAGAWGILSHPGRAPSEASTKGATPRNVTLASVALAPLAAWSAYVVWRGTVIPPVSEDALIYHLPKAALLALRHGFEYFAPVPDDRISNFPANYELLLSNVFLLDGSDRFTSVLSLIAWVLLAISGGALAERWWGKGSLHPLVTAIFVAGTPVAILHSGQLKHDLLSAFFGVSAFLWFARWASEGGDACFVLAGLAVALGAGTKVPFGCVIVGIAVSALWLVVTSGEVRNRFTPRLVLLTLTLGAASAVLLGGAAYLATFRHTGTLLGGNVTGAPPVLLHPARVDLGNLWQFPYLLATVPFSRSPNFVWVPWAGENWFWSSSYPEHSHYGIAFTLFMLAAPFVAYAMRTRDPSPDRRMERRVASLATFVAFLLPSFVPQHLQAQYAHWPRYLLFATPAIACWSVAPVTRLLENAGARWRGAAVAIVVGSSMIFLWQAVKIGLRDTFAPFDYVCDIAAHRRPRTTKLMPNRAEAVVDRLAGPKDPVAVHAGHDAWLYPIFGRGLTRPVTFLDVPASGMVTIPSDVLFVAIDRPSNILWGAPGLTHVGRELSYLWKGSPSTEDLAVFRQLTADTRYRLIFHDASRNQAVFARSDVAVPLIMDAPSVRGE